MSNAKILEEIIKYYKENNSLFCMPGHKAGAGFQRDKIGRKFLEFGLKLDITEVEPLDNYHNPQGIIKQAQEDLSKLYGSYSSYFLVNGSTSGNLAMIFSVFEQGDKILIERNCHKSIYNGVILRKLKPIYIKNKIDKNLGVSLSIDTEDFLYKIENTENLRGILLTYPNYYGVCLDLKLIINKAREKGIYVLIDSAHGAHFGINKKLPEGAVKLGADMVVCSTHKTLPSLTQSAYIHINNEKLDKKVKRYLHIFSSTSPSYLLMASADYGRYYLETYGNDDYDKLLNLCDKYREKINQLEGFRILSKQDLEYGEDIDRTRYVIISTKDINMNEVAVELRKNHIQCEMHDKISITFIFSPFQDEDEFIKLYHCLDHYNDKMKNRDNKKNIYYEVSHPAVKILPHEAEELQSESLDYKDSKGYIAAEAIIPYPPGVPLIVPGEVISDEIIRVITFYIEGNVDIIGLNEDNIKVIKQKLGDFKYE